MTKRKPSEIDPFSSLFPSSMERRESLSRDETRAPTWIAALQLQFYFWGRGVYNALVEDFNNRQRFYGRSRVEIVLAGPVLEISLEIVSSTLSLSLDIRSQRSIAFGKFLGSLRSRTRRCEGRSGRMKTSFYEATPVVRLRGGGGEESRSANSRVSRESPPKSRKQRRARFRRFG